MTEKQYGEAHELPDGFLGSGMGDEAPDLKSLFGDGPKRKLRAAPEPESESEPEDDTESANPTQAPTAQPPKEPTTPKKQKRRATPAPSNDHTPAQAEGVRPDRPKPGGFYIRAKDIPVISEYVKQRRLTNWEFLVEAFRATRDEWQSLFKPTLNEEDLFEPRATGRRPHKETLAFWNVRNTDSDKERIEKWAEQSGARSRSEFVSAVFERYLTKLEASETRQGM